MKYRVVSIPVVSIAVIFLLTCMTAVPRPAVETGVTVDAPKTLYDSIVTMDTTWEQAYNTCDMTVMEAIISEDLEFYHDQGGVMTSKQKLNEALQRNICGKITRVLKPGSIEVYSIAGYGAVEMGMHGFRNKAEAGADIHFAKFVHIWKRNKGQWQITRVISLH